MIHQEHIPKEVTAAVNDTKNTIQHHISRISSPSERISKNRNKTNQKKQNKMWRRPRIRQYRNIVLGIGQLS